MLSFPDLKNFAFCTAYYMQLGSAATEFSADWLYKLERISLI